MLQQVAPRRLHHADIAHLPVVEPGFRQEVEGAEDAVQGRAHLVAHDRQKLGLRLLARHGQIAGGDKLAFGPDAIRYVPDEGHDQFAFGAVGRGNREFDRNDLAGLVHHLVLIGTAVRHGVADGAQEALHVLRDGGAKMAGDHQLGNIGADGLVARIAEDALGRAVVVDDPALRRDDENRVDRRRNHRLKPASPRRDLFRLPLRGLDQDEQRADRGHERGEEQEHDDAKVEKRAGDAVALHFRGGGEDAHGLKCDQPHVVVHGVQLAGNLRKGVAQGFGRAVDKGHRPVDEGLDRAARVLKLGQAADRGERNRFLEGLESRIEHVEPAAHGGEVGFGVDERLDDGGLEGQKLHLDLGDGPLRAVAVGGGQPVDLAPGVGREDPDHHGRGHDGQREEQAPDPDARPPGRRQISRRHRWRRAVREGRKGGRVARCCGNRSPRTGIPVSNRRDRRSIMDPCRARPCLRRCGGRR